MPPNFRLLCGAVMLSILLTSSHSSEIYFDFLFFNLFVIKKYSYSYRKAREWSCSSTLTSYKEPGIYNFFMSRMMGWLPPNFRFLCGSVMLSMLHSSMLNILLRSTHSNEVRILLEKEYMYFEFLLFHASKRCCYNYREQARQGSCSSSLTFFKEPGIYNFFMSKMMGLLPPNFRFLCGAVMLSLVYCIVYWSVVLI